MRPCTPPALLGLLAFVGAAVAAAEGPALDLEGLLARPSVRMLAVEVLGPGSVPGPELASKWRRVQIRYGSAGLRVVVVARAGDDGRCAPLPWTPDVLVCDTDGGVAQQLGATGRSATFLWSWRGELLVDGGSVEAVDAAAGAQQAREPVLEVEVRDEAGRPQPVLSVRTRSELIKLDKFTVVSDPPRRVRDKRRAGAAEPRCDVDQALSTRVLLRGSLAGRGESQTLSYELVSVDRGCASEPVQVPFDENEPNLGLRSGLGALFARLTDAPGQSTAMSAHAPSAHAAAAEPARLDPPPAPRPTVVDQLPVDQLPVDQLPAVAAAQGPAGGDALTLPSTAEAAAHVSARPEQIPLPRVPTDEAIRGPARPERKVSPRDLSDEDARAPARSHARWVPSRAPSDDVARAPARPNDRWVPPHRPSEDSARPTAPPVPLAAPALPAVASPQPTPAPQRLSVPPRVLADVSRAAARSVADAPPRRVPAPDARAPDEPVRVASRPVASPGVPTAPQTPAVVGPLPAPGGQEQAQLTLVASGTLGGIVHVPNGSILFLNRGHRHGVVMGMRGKLCDIAFVVQKVDERNSEAFTRATLDQVGRCSAFNLFK